MSIRHAALVSGAVLVLGLGVYLWIEVHAQPVAVASPGAVPQRTPDPVAPAAPAAPPGAAAAVRVAAAAPAVAPVASSPVGSPGAPAAAPPPGLPGAPAGAAPTDSELLAGPRLDAAMAEANRAYDRGDLDEAKTLALHLLAQQPSNVRMLRIMVSASCIDGDTPTAQVHFAKLPAPDQAQMRIRCARYGVSFPDKP